MERLRQPLRDALRAEAVGEVFGDLVLGEQLERQLDALAVALQRMLEIQQRVLPHDQINRPKGGGGSMLQDALCASRSTGA